MERAHQSQRTPWCACHWPLGKLKIMCHCHLERHLNVSTQTTQQGVLQAEVTHTHPEVSQLLASRHPATLHWVHGTKVVASPPS